MSESYTGFIDASYLRAEGAKAIGQSPKGVRPDALAVVKWFRDLGLDQRFLRAYWYDSAFDPAHPNYSGQRSFFDAIALAPGLQLRLGHIAESAPPFEQPIRRAIQSAAWEMNIDGEEFLKEFDKHWTFRAQRHQKGVDTLITLDMIRLASRAAGDTMVLLAGDRDFAEVIREAQAFGTRVFVATPRRQSMSWEIGQLADEVIDITEEQLKLMLTPRPGAS